MNQPSIYLPGCDSGNPEFWINACIDFYCVHAMQGCVYYLDIALHYTNIDYMEYISVGVFCALKIMFYWVQHGIDVYT